MVNKVTLIGRLGKDPQVKHFSETNAVADFTLATSDNYRDKTGNWVEVTDWHNIRLPFKSLADRAEKQLHKGSLIYLEGKIKTRSYDDKDGNKRYVTEVVVENFRSLDKRENANQEGGGGNYENQSQGGGTSQPSAQAGGGEEFSDDLPF